MPNTVDVPFSEEVIVSTGLTSHEFIEKVRFTTAATFYRDGRLSAGQAAKLCGMGKVEFLFELPKHGFAISNLGPENAEEELRLARQEMARAK
ncbi:MAG: UPF0175 family protein [Planctomycetaceae bacterium]|nr:UPF0175 family protein [Planctomycetaceae bacterium]